MSFEGCKQEVSDLLGEYEHKIKLSNNSGLPNHSRTSETVYCGLFNILYPGSNYQTPDNINEKAIDLFDPVTKNAVQIKANLSPKKIEECFEKFTQTKWFVEERYDFTILLTASQCSVAEQPFVVNGYSYYNNANHYLDNSRLIHRLNVNNCQMALDYLKEAIGSSGTDKKASANITNYHGSVVNISNSGGDFNLNSALFNDASDNRKVTMQGENSYQSALTSYKKGRYSEALNKSEWFLESNTDESRQIDGYYLYVISKLSRVNILHFTDIEVDEIYEYLEYLDNTQYKKMADVLWLIVYFENVATHAPPALAEQMKDQKLEQLSYILPHFYKEDIENITVYAKKTQDFLEQLRYDSQYAE